MHCNGNISIIKFPDESIFKKHKRKMCNDTAFSDFGGMLPADRNIALYKFLNIIFNQKEAKLWSQRITS